MEHYLWAHQTKGFIETQETPQEYYIRIMGEYHKNRVRRCLRKSSQYDGIDYQSIQNSIKEFGPILPPGFTQAERNQGSTPLPGTHQHFIPLTVDGGSAPSDRKQSWSVSHLAIEGPEGIIEIRSESLTAIIGLLSKII